MNKTDLQYLKDNKEGRFTLINLKTYSEILSLDALGDIMKYLIARDDHHYLTLKGAYNTVIAVRKSDIEFIQTLSPEAIELVLLKESESEPWES